VGGTKGETKPEEESERGREAGGGIWVSRKGREGLWATSGKRRRERLIGREDVWVEEV
jgi:hypothetical protein